MFASCWCRLGVFPYVGSIDHRVGEVARLFGFDTWLVVGDVRSNLKRRRTVVMNVEDQAARLAREPGVPLLVNFSGVWVNPGHVVGVWWTSPGDDRSMEGHTTIRMSDGQSIDVDAPLDEVVAKMNG